MGADFPESSVRAAGLSFEGNVHKTEILMNVTVISCVVARTMDPDLKTVTGSGVLS